MEHQKKVKHRTLATHPLCGADVKTLWSVFRRSGGIQLDRVGDMGMILCSALARLPFNWMERVYVDSILPERRPSAPPIFILGHWRSGTTHLYNILSKSPSFGYLPPIATGIPWNMLLLGRWLEPWLIKTLPSERFIDNVPVQHDSPQEDEIALANMIDVSFYHGLYFPKHFRSYFNQGVYFDRDNSTEVARWKKAFLYFMNKLSLLNEGKAILVKNPVYTARVALLREMYPDAKFIHIHRNPFRVFESMMNFYRNLFRELAFQPYDHLSIPNLVLEHYPKIMDRLVSETADLPSGQFIELGYDMLDQQPMQALEQIYDQIDLGDFEQDKPHFLAYLDSVKRYQKNRYEYSRDTVDLVQKHWGRFVERWNYAVPTIGKGDGDE